MEDKYLTLEEVCEALSISTATAKNWLKLGKIGYDKISVDNRYLFLSSKVQSLKQALISGENLGLKSRRNKNFARGNSIYKSYISDSSKNVSVIQKLLDIISSEKITLTDDLINLLVAECAIQLYMVRRHQNHGSNLLCRFLSGDLDIPEFSLFVSAFISDKNASLNFIRENAKLFEVEYSYEFGEDILGLLYLSTKNIGNRKAAGAYYTPTKIVKHLVENIFDDVKICGREKVFDPCCGTGNFLLQLPKAFGVDNIFANDIDEISAKITRINLALHFENYDYSALLEHVTSVDYLKCKKSDEFDYIIGNPPWGGKFSPDDKKCLKKIYKSAQGKNLESFDIVIEAALGNLKNCGVLSFVVPEAILNVRTHKKIREIMFESCEIQYLEYLGNPFDKVQCPAVILQIKKTNKPMSGLGLRVKDKTREFEVNVLRNISVDNFLFRANDEEYELISKLLKMKNCTTLKNHAIFALGIVTGNNSRYLSFEKTDENELILKGSDIYQYKIVPSDNYISYNPEKFQQVAHTEDYRAKEKLFYRFISNRLIFAYDNKQRLSLNSCNILIPKIKNLDMKYIMAVLNSRISQFIYSKHFGSVKVLRSHLEQIPIPFVDKPTQQKIIDIVEKIMDEDSLELRKSLYLELDNNMFDIFNLNKFERDMIFKETKDIL